MKLLKRIGVTSEIWQIFVQDNSKTTGEGLTSLSATNTSVLCYYKRNNASAAVAVTLADMTLGAYTSGGLKAVANMPGFFDFCPPDAALATGASSVAFLLYPATTTVAMAPVTIEVQLTQADFDNATSLGLSNLDAAMSTRLPTSSYVAPDNTSTAAIKAKTDNLPSDPASTTDVNTRLATSGYTAPDNAGIVAIKAKTDLLNFVGADVSADVSSLTAGALNQIRNKFLLVNDSLNAPTVGARTVTLAGVVENNNNALVGATLVHFKQSGELVQLRTIVATNIATQEVTVDEDWLVAPGDTDVIRVYEMGNSQPKSMWLFVAEGTKTALQFMRGMASALLGKSSGHVAGASAPVYRDVADTKDRITATTDADGNRTAVTLDLD